MQIPKPEKRGPKPRKRIERGTRPAALAKRGSRGKLRQLADDTMSLYVRSRDGWRCRRCGDTQGVQQNSHLYPKGAYPALRYNAANAVDHCAACHRFLTDRPIEFREWIHATIGAELAGRLEQIAVTKMAAPHDYVAITLRYLGILKVMIHGENLGPNSPPRYPMDLPFHVRDRYDALVLRAQKLGVMEQQVAA